jgi:hypothetical protein
VTPGRRGLLQALSGATALALRSVYAIKGSLST